MNPDFTKNPSWNLSSEYQSLTDSIFLHDVQSVQNLNIELQKRTQIIKTELQKKQFPIDTIQKTISLNSEAHITLRNLTTYLRCLSSVDSQNQDVKNKTSELEKMYFELAESFNFVSLFLKRCEGSEFESIFSHPELKAHRWNWELAREIKDQLLSEQEESLITTLSNPGFHEWGNLYQNLSGKIKVNVGEQKMGLAQAHSLLKGPDASLREKAWNGIQDAWTIHEESAAGI